MKKLTRDRVMPIVLIWEGHREKNGRLLARVMLPDGQDMAEAIVKAGYAVNCDGGWRLGWRNQRSVLLTGTAVPLQKA